MSKKQTIKVAFIYYQNLSMSMASESIFVKALGASAWAKVWDYFLTFREFDHTKTHVAETTGVARMTVDKIWDKMIKMKIIIMYMMNVET